MQFARKDAPEFVRLSGAGYTRRDMLEAGGIAMAAVTVPTLSPFVTRAGAQETPQGGTLIVGLVAEPTSLDPGQLTDINSM